MHVARLIVPSDIPLPDIFEGVDYHDGFLFDTLVEATEFARKAVEDHPGVIVDYEIKEGVTALDRLEPTDRQHVEMLDTLYQADVLTKSEWLKARRRITEAPEHQPSGSAPTERTASWAPSSSPAS
jgi:hypothetical protein